MRIPNLTMLRASDSAGKRLYERDIRGMPHTKLKVFPSDVDVKERVPMFDNPKMFHMLLLNYLHDINEGVYEDYGMLTEIPLYCISYTLINQVNSEDIESVLFG